MKKNNKTNSIVAHHATNAYQTEIDSAIYNNQTIKHKNKKIRKA
jgi:hypothetical protein